MKLFINQKPFATQATSNAYGFGMQASIELVHRDLHRIDSPDTKSVPALIDSGSDVDGFLPRHLYESCCENLPAYDKLPESSRLLVGANGEIIAGGAAVATSGKRKAKPLRYCPTGALWIHPFGDGVDEKDPIRVPLAMGLYIPDNTIARPLIGLPVLRSIRARLSSDHIREVFSLEIPRAHLESLRRVASKLRSVAAAMSTANADKD